MHVYRYMYNVFMSILKQHNIPASVQYVCVCVCVLSCLCISTDRLADGNITVNKSNAQMFYYIE